MASASRWLPPATRWLGSGSNAATCSRTSAESRSAPSAEEISTRREDGLRRGEGEIGGGDDLRHGGGGGGRGGSAGAAPPPDASLAAARATARPAACSSSVVSSTPRGSRT